MLVLDWFTRLDGMTSLWLLLWYVLFQFTIYALRFIIRREFSEA